MWRRNSNARACSGFSEELVLWENTTNEEVLKRARTEIWQSWAPGVRRERRSPARR